MVCLTILFLKTKKIKFKALVPKKMAYWVQMGGIQRDGTGKNEKVTEISPC